MKQEGGKLDERREEGLGGRLDMEEHMVVLCSMLKTHIYFVRATAVTVLGIFIQYFIDIYLLEKDNNNHNNNHNNNPDDDSLSELRKMEDSVLKVRKKDFEILNLLIIFYLNMKILLVAQKDSDGIVMESALRALGYFKEYITEEGLKALVALLDHPRYQYTTLTPTFTHSPQHQNFSAACELLLWRHWVCWGIAPSRWCHT